MNKFFKVCEFVRNNQMEQQHDTPESTVSQLLTLCQEQDLLTPSICNALISSLEAQLKCFGRGSDVVRALAVVQSAFRSTDSLKTEKLEALQKLYHAMMPVNIIDSIKLQQEAYSRASEWQNSGSLGFVNDREITLLIGKTHAGKSTTLLFLAGCDFEFTEQKSGEAGIVSHYQVVLNEKRLTAIPNLQTVVTSWERRSETKYVNPIRIPLDSMDPIKFKRGQYCTICDTAGFGDTNGPEVDISNALSILKLTEEVSRIKIVALVSCTSSGDTGEGYLEMANLLAKLFPNIKSVDDDALKSIVYVFTKYPNDMEMKHIHGELCSKYTNYLESRSYSKISSTFDKIAFFLLDMCRKTNPTDKVLTLPGLCTGPPIDCDASLIAIDSGNATVQCAAYGSVLLRLCDSSTRLELLDKILFATATDRENISIGLSDESSQYLSKQLRIEETFLENAFANQDVATIQHRIAKLCKWRSVFVNCNTSVSVTSSMSNAVQLVQRVLSESHDRISKTLFCALQEAPPKFCIFLQSLKKTLLFVQSLKFLNDLYIEDLFVDVPLYIGNLFDNLRIEIATYWDSFWQDLEERKKRAHSLIFNLVSASNDKAACCTQSSGVQESSNDFCSCDILTLSQAGFRNLLNERGAVILVTLKEFLSTVYMDQWILDGDIMALTNTIETCVYYKLLLQYTDLKEESFALIQFAVTNKIFTYIKDSRSNIEKMVKMNTKFGVTTFSSSTSNISVAEINFYISFLSQLGTLKCDNCMVASSNGNTSALCWEKLCENVDDQTLEDRKKEIIDLLGLYFSNHVSNGRILFSSPDKLKSVIKEFTYFQDCPWYWELKTKWETILDDSLTSYEKKITLLLPENKNEEKKLLTLLQKVIAFLPIDEYLCVFVVRRCLWKIHEEISAYLEELLSHFEDNKHAVMARMTSEVAKEYSLALQKVLLWEQHLVPCLTSLQAADDDETGTHLIDTSQLSDILHRIRMLLITAFQSNWDRLRRMYTLPPVTCEDDKLYYSHFLNVKLSTNAHVWAGEHNSVLFAISELLTCFPDLLQSHTDVAEAAHLVQSFYKTMANFVIGQIRWMKEKVFSGETQISDQQLRDCVSKVKFSCDALQWLSNKGDDGFHFFHDILWTPQSVQFSLYDLSQQIAEVEHLDINDISRKVLILELYFDSFFGSNIFRSLKESLQSKWAEKKINKKQELETAITCKLVKEIDRILLNSSTSPSLVWNHFSFCEKKVLTVKLAEVYDALILDAINLTSKLLTSFVEGAPHGQSDTELREALHLLRGFRDDTFKDVLPANDLNRYRSVIHVSLPDLVENTVQTLVVSSLSLLETEDYMKVKKEVDKAYLIAETFQNLDIIHPKTVETVSDLKSKVVNYHTSVCSSVGHWRDMNAIKVQRTYSSLVECECFSIAESYRLVIRTALLHGIEEIRQQQIACTVKTEPDVSFLSSIVMDLHNIVTPQCVEEVNLLEEIEALLHSEERLSTKEVTTNLIGDKNGITGWCSKTLLLLMLGFLSVLVYYLGRGIFGKSNNLEL